MADYQSSDLDPDQAMVLRDLLLSSQTTNGRWPRKRVRFIPVSWYHYDLRSWRHRISTRISQLLTRRRAAGLLGISTNRYSSLENGKQDVPPSLQRTTPIPRTIVLACLFVEERLDLFQKQLSQPDDTTN